MPWAICIAVPWAVAVVSRISTFRGFLFGVKVDCCRYSGVYFWWAIFGAAAQQKKTYSNMLHIRICYIFYMYYTYLLAHTRAHTSIGMYIHTHIPQCCWLQVDPWVKWVRKELGFNIYGNVKGTRKISQTFKNTQKNQLKWQWKISELQTAWQIIASRGIAKHNSKKYNKFIYILKYTFDTH